MANDAAIATFHKNLHNDIIMQVGHCIWTRYKYSWVVVFLGLFYSGNVVVGRSIYGVVVIDGSLYSRFYGVYKTWVL